MFQPTGLIAESPDLSKASWIWADKGGLSATGPVCYFRCKFQLDSIPAEATIVLTADNGYELYVNNQRIAAELGAAASVWSSVERFRIERHLVEGANAISIRGESLGASAGVIAAVNIRTADGKTIELVTNETWLSIVKPDGNWNEPDHDDSLWKPAVVLARLGDKPWGMLRVPDKLTDPKTLVVNRGNPGRPAVKHAFSEPGPDFQWPAGVVFIAGRAPEHSTNAAKTKFKIAGTESAFEYDTPAPSVSGRKLFAMTPATPDTKPRLLLDAGRGLIASPTCSYDGKEIIFAMVPEGEKFFKLFRVGVDGSGLERLTTGPWQDYDPAILPDGRIVFASSRRGSRDEYHGNTARSLFCLSADRSTIRPLTYHIVADAQPRVMPDGRIAFVRYDNFMERAKVETRIHSIHPDGTAGQTLIGPDRGKIAYDRPTGAEHASNWLRRYGFGSPAPLADGRIACLTGFGPMISSVSLRDRVAREKMPSGVPLFDISALPDGRLLCSTPDGKLGILDPNTGKAVKLTDSVGDLHSVRYLGPKPKPREMAHTVSLDAQRQHDKSGYLFCQNIADTQQTDGDWKRVKAVRVFIGKPFTLRAARHQYGHIGIESIELGLAPLAPDGSFSIRVPADRALALQAVDAEGRPVVNEMSWIYVRPNEFRSCTGCHNPRQATPDFKGTVSLAALARPVDLMPQGNPHRFRGNNAANGGVLNQQFDRFREVASIDSYRQPAFPLGLDPRSLRPGRQIEVDKQLKILEKGDVAKKASAARRLAVFRDRSAVPGLVNALTDSDASVRTAVAMALSACGNRVAVEPLLGALNDRDPHVAQAANIALEHLTGHSEPLNPYRRGPQRGKEADPWKAWLDNNDWDRIEAGLIERIGSEDTIESHLAIEALGHVGRERAKSALRDYVAKGSKDSLVARLAAIRALGHLKDEESVPMLGDLLERTTAKVALKPAKSHEFGWAAMPDHLAGAAAEALGRIATPEAEQRLIATFDRLAEFWYYTYRTADHDWLMGCHSSIIHFRIAEALEAIGSKKAAGLTGKLLRCVPIDTDRALLHENDAYETVIARLIQRSGMGPAVVDTCLVVLGDKNAKGSAELTAAVTASPPAKSVGPLSPQSRAAHLLSIVCLRPEDAPPVRAAFERYRAQEPSRVQSWVCFFLARTLGKLGDRESVDVLRSALDDDPTEASFGLPDPPNVFIHDAMTPLYRASAADALGRIGDKQAVPSLLAAVKNYENAMDVRRAAAEALGRIADPAGSEEIEALAEDYPEISTAQALREAHAAIVDKEDK